MALGLMAPTVSQGFLKATGCRVKSKKAVLSDGPGAADFSGVLLLNPAQFAKVDWEMSACIMWVTHLMKSNKVQHSSPTLSNRGEK